MPTLLPYQVGVPTVGYNGMFRVTGTAGAEAAIKECLDMFGTAHLLPGVYQFNSTLIGDYSGARITGTHEAILKPCSNAVGLFDFWGTGITMEGFKVHAEDFVANQTLIKFAGTSTRIARDIKCRDILFQIDTSPLPITNGAVVTQQDLIGSESTPMVCIEFSETLRKTVDNCIFLPNFAVTCIKTTRGAAHTFINNNFCNNVDAGLGFGATIWSTQTPPFNVQSLVTLANPRQMYRGIQLDGDEWGMVANNRFWGLGDNSSSAPNTELYKQGDQFVDACIRYNITANIALDEQMHSQCIGNRIEAVATKGAVRLYGVNSLTFALNLIGYIYAAPNAVGEAAVVIAGVDGNSTANPSRSVLMFGNDLHNNGAESSDGCAIYAKQCTDLVVRACRFGVQSSNYAIIIDTPTVVGFSAIANHFQAQVPQDSSVPVESIVDYGIHLLPGTIGATLLASIGENFEAGYAVSANTYNGFELGLVHDESNAGATGARKILTGIQNTSTNNDNTASLTTNIRLDA